MDLDTFIGWTVAIACATWLACHYLGPWLMTLAGRHVDRMVADALAVIDAEDDWLGDVIGLDETPIYSATAAYIAEHAAAGLDDEWAELNGGAS